MKKLLFTIIISGVLIGNLGGCQTQKFSSQEDEILSTAERSQFRELTLPPEQSRVGVDPQQMTLELYGLSEESGEGNFQQAISVQSDNELAIALLTQLGLGDDSVYGQQYRLEFVSENNQWRLVWVGTQVRCLPGRGSQTWTKNKCS